MIIRQPTIYNHQLRRGFTLIELLVVIAIISLLVSILLPSLNRAKELAKRVLCASNQHNITLAHALYANEYKNYVPVGYWSTKQMNYLIYDAGLPAGYDPFIIFGGLYLAELMSEPKVYYCPSETTDSGACFNTSRNPWPPGSGGKTRSGYGSRPEVNWTSSTRVRKNELGSKTIVADWTSAASNVSGRHNDGLNAGYMDGSASWIDLSLFDEDINQIAAGSYSSANNVLVESIWKTFDEQH